VPGASIRHISVAACSCVEVGAAGASGTFEDGVDASDDVDACVDDHGAVVVAVAEIVADQGASGSGTSCPGG